MTLKDNEDQKKKIILKPGEMLLYESAKVPHGRQFPLEGEYYENVLVRVCQMCQKFENSSNLDKFPLLGLSTLHNDHFFLKILIFGSASSHFSV